MKKWADKLQENTGETLVESVLSLMIFSLIMLTVTLMLGTALKMIQAANTVGANLQETVNEASSVVDGSKGTVIFAWSSGGSTEVDVMWKDSNGILTFVPEGP